MQLGDSRTGKLADNLAAFARSLRRAGVRVDSARIALSTQAALAVGLANQYDLSAALEAVLVSREQDRMVFRELFEAFFRNPNMAHKLLSQLLPSAEGKAEPSKRRPRLKHADFNALSATEYRLVERLARDIRMPLPTFASRRNQQGVRGAALHWAGVLRQGVRTGGEPMVLPRLSPKRQPLPLLVLVDVSGSMERYARLLLAFLHAATRRHPRRDVFAFGTQLTDLTPAFRMADTDAMLAHASALIEDFAGGTQLGVSLAQLRAQHARKLVGRRTMVLVITDGLDTGAPVALAQELLWLKRHSRRLLWLNPLLRFEGYAPLAQGAAELHRAADAMLAVHNLSSLEQLATSLAAVMRR